MLDIIEFVKSVSKIENLPKLKLPEIVVCGRSNVGKSTFINCIFNKKNIAKVSSTPGKTRTINYYLVDGKFYLVDLPGYGYAKVSKEEKNKWAELIETYLLKSENIKLVLHLVDSKILPSQLDLMMNKILLHCNLNYVLLFNKVDKLNQSLFEKNKKEYVKSFSNLKFGIDLIPFSSKTGIGKKQVLKIISNSVNF